jgi:hypothetical protein
MSFLLPSIPRKLYPSVQLSLGSTDEIERTKQIILAILIIGTGLTILAPVLQAPRPIYLPPITQPERDYYSQKIHTYSQQLAEPKHTQVDHLRLADALANLGEREAAAEAYLKAMEDHSKSHTH